MFQSWVAFVVFFLFSHVPQLNSTWSFVFVFHRGRLLQLCLEQLRHRPGPVRNLSVVLIDWSIYRCSLNENAQMALFATWLALLGASAVEFAVALYRGLDRSPRLFRLVYAPWLVNGIAISAYVLARPGATVRDQTDAAVLLTLHATGISLAIGLAFAHYVMMLGVLSQALGKFRPNENESKDKLTNYQQSFERIALVGMGASAVICIVLFSIVTNSLGVGSASPEDLELVLTIGWAVQSFCLLAQMLIFSYISWRIRGIIHEQVVFEREVINRIASVDPSATEKKPPSTLAQLENTMIFVSVMGTINALLTCSLFIVAAVLGMQYWYLNKCRIVILKFYSWQDLSCLHGRAAHGRHCLPHALPIPRHPHLVPAVPGRHRLVVLLWLHGISKEPRQQPEPKPQSPRLRFDKHDDHRRRRRRRRRRRCR